jgi:hypothetical protein
MHLLRFERIRFRGALQLLLFSLIIVLIQPSPDLVTYGEQQNVDTTIPHLGVHTRLTDEVEEWKIQRSLKMVREVGAPWIVELFPWAYYQGEDGGYAWDHPDMVINHASAQGLKVIARLGMTPKWARPPETTLNYLDESSFKDFAQYSADFASRYRGKADHIIIWNEPNLSYEWGYQPSNPSTYVKLLKTVYPRIKGANPDAVVLAGALAPTLEPAGSPWGLNDLEFLREMYTLGAADYFDGLAVHAYGLTFPADAEPHPSILNFRRVELVREIMVEFGDEGTPVFITETGWNDHPRWSLAVKPGQRIQYTIDAIEYATKNWPFVDVLAFWAFRYPAPTKSYPDYFTFVTPEFITKPIYDILKKTTGN